MTQQGTEDLSYYGIEKLRDVGKILRFIELLSARFKTACGRPLIVCSAVLLCLTQVAAQSGRRPKPPVSVPAPVNSEPTPASTVESPRMTSIIIGGHDIDPDTKEIWSNDTSTVAKACTQRLKERRLNLEIVYGGKMTKVEAVERAKKQTDSYVLWFGYRSKLVGLDEVIDYLEYLVFLPQTGKTLTEGRVYPAKEKTTADPGGIMRLPTRRRRQSNTHLLEQGGREVADRVRGVL